MADDGAREEAFGAEAFGAKAFIVFFRGVERNGHQMRQETNQRATDSVGRILFISPFPSSLYHYILSELRSKIN